jgi:anti-sigma28 factor (negative regulator of flagellin synthesis)
MKIPGSDGSDKAAVVRFSENRPNETAPLRRGDSLLQEVAREEGANGGDGSDTVSFSATGAVMYRELNAAALAEERRAKIDDIKKRIQNGTYAPSTEVVAGSVAEEISLEVLLGGDALRNS